MFALEVSIGYAGLIKVQNENIKSFVCVSFFLQNQNCKEEKGKTKPLYGCQGVLGL